jgi:hypothetical protein
MVDVLTLFKVLFIYETRQRRRRRQRERKGFCCLRVVIERQDGENALQFIENYSRCDPKHHFLSVRAGMNTLVLKMQGGETRNATLHRKLNENSNITRSSFCVGLTVSIRRNATNSQSMRTQTARGYLLMRVSLCGKYTHTQSRC